MKRMYKIAVAILIALLAVACFLYFNNAIGVNEISIEQNARKTQKIENDWQVATDITDTMSAMIFYPEDMSDHTFSISVNRSGLSFGYFFRSGGNIVAVEQYVAEFTVEGYNDRAFVSLNKPQVARVEIDDGNSVQTTQIDSNKPFVIVVPKDIGHITFYNIDGNIVETMNNPL